MTQPKGIRRARGIAAKIITIAKRLLEQESLDQATLLERLRNQGFKVEEGFAFSENTARELKALKRDSMPVLSEGQFFVGSFAWLDNRQAQIENNPNARMTFIYQTIIDGCVLVCFKQQPDPHEALLLASYLRLSRALIVIRICTHADEHEPVLSKEWSTAILDLEEAFPRRS